MSQARNQNLEYAKYGLETCKQRYPLGGLNRMNVIEKYGNSELFKMQYAFRGKYRAFGTIESHDELSADETREKHLLEAQLLGGYCTELADFGIEIILAKYPHLKNSIEKACLTQHAFIVIGRDPSSDPNNILTWGEQAFICDPWAELIYPVTEFAEVQRVSRIPYREKQFKAADLTKSNYLLGNPEIESRVQARTTFSTPQDLHTHANLTGAEWLENAFKYCEIKDFKRVETVLQSALPFLQAENNPLGLVAYYLLLADAEFGIGRIKSAIDTLQKGVLYGDGIWNSIASPTQFLKTRLAEYLEFLKENQYPNTEILFSNLISAEYGLRECQSKYPLGGLNRKDVFDKNACESNFSEQLCWAKQLSEILSAEILQQRIDKTLTPTKTELSAKVKGGLPAGLALSIGEIILQQFPEANVEIANLGVHDLIIIGRAKGSDPEQMETWGTSTVVCDPWAAKVYPLVALPLFQAEETITFYSGYELLPTHPVAISVTLHDHHYLAGDLKIICNMAETPAAKAKRAQKVYLEAATYYKKQKFQEAFNLFGRAASQFSDIADKDNQIICYSGLISCARETKQFPEALKICNLALKVFPDGDARLEKVLEKQALIRKMVADERIDVAPQASGLQSSSSLFYVAPSLSSPSTQQEAKLMSTEKKIKLT